MSKYSKLIEKMGFRFLNDIEHGHGCRMILQKDGGDCWLFYGYFKTRKEAYEHLLTCRLAEIDAEY